MPSSGTRLQDKVALIAGCASGIGAATAAMMAREGASLLLADIDLDGVEAVAAAIRSAGGEAVATRMDIADDRQTAAAVCLTVERYGRLDILHNNAAALDAATIGQDSQADILTLAPKLLDRTLNVNLKGLINTARHAVPEMLKTGGGAVVNTSSIGSLVAEPMRHAYEIAKAGVNMLTKQIAANYGRRGVRCNAVLPGLVITDSDKFPREYVDMYLRYSSMPYPGRPDDIAALVVFLASDEARLITGQLISADGGVLNRAPWMQTLLEGGTDVVRY